MNNLIRPLLAACVGLASVVLVHAQAPTSLQDFSGKVMRLQTLTNPLGGSIGGALLRITPTNSSPFTNGTTIVGGSLIITTGNATNVTYAQLSTDGALMRVLSASTNTIRTTNEISLRFVTATNGVFTNVYLASSNGSLRQTNGIGNFTLIPGTNAVPAVDSITGGGIVQPGDTPTVFVSGNGFAFKYQWRANGTNIPGATNFFYNITNISATTAGNYLCVLSNELGSATSSFVTFTLADPIVILQQPQSQTVMINSYLNLSFAATGSIRNFTWLQDGSQALGVNTNTNYFIAQINATRAGKYSVQINGYGITTNTSNAVITVRNWTTNRTWLGRAFEKIADDRSLPVPGQAQHVFTNWANPAFTPLMTFRDGKVHFVAGTSAGVRSLFRWSNGVLSTLVFTNTPDPLGGFFGDIFYPTDEGAGVVNFASGGMYAWAAGGITNIISTNTPVPGRTNTFFGPGSFGRRNDGVALSTTVAAAGTGMFFAVGTNFTTLADNTIDLPGVLTNYAFRPTANSVNYDGTTVVFSTTVGPPLFEGGFFKSTPQGVITKLADHTDARPDGFGNLANFSDVDVDGGLIFGSADGVIYAFESNGSFTNVGYGFFVSAAGPRVCYYHDGGYLYRWNDGETDLVLQPGHVIDDRVVSSIVGADGQGDDVAVTLKFSDNTYGIYIIRGTASTTPVIVSEPLDFNAIENGNAAFHVSAAGQGPLFYQWFQGATLLANRTNVSLLLTNIQTVDLGGYSVIVSNANGSVTSRVAQLTRSAPPIPTILSGPTINPTGVFGSNTVISVNGAGQGVTYQWFKNGLLLPGATTNFISLTNLGASDRTNYFVVLSNSASVVTSSVANLTIAPVIVSQPVSATNLVGETATFTVVANGIPPLTYQWRRGSGTPNTIISGATTNTLTITNVVATNAVNYRVTVTSSGGGSSLNSSVVSLTVLSTNLPAPNAPFLTAPIVVSNVFQFFLPTQNGYTYEVQSQTNLGATNWVIEQTINGDGSTKTVTVDAGPTQKTIRVQAK